MVKEGSRKRKGRTEEVRCRIGSFERDSGVLGGIEMRKIRMQ